MMQATQKLQIAVTGTNRIKTADNFVNAKRFLFRTGFKDNESASPYMIDTMFEGNLLGQQDPNLQSPYDLLLGMDVLAHCCMVIDGVYKKFILSY